MTDEELVALAKATNIQGVHPNLAALCEGVIFLVEALQDIRDETEDEQYDTSPAGRVHRMANAALNGYRL